MRVQNGVVVLRSTSTIVTAPAPGTRPATELPGHALPVLLSVIAGATDIIGFLGLKGLFTAHITGNLVVLAARMIAGDPAIVSVMLSVPVFMLALLLTKLIAGVIADTGRSTLAPLLLLQLLMLVAFLVLSVIAGPWKDPDAALAIVAGMFGVSAMAVQNALVQIALRNTPSTAVMTTNVTHLMLDIGTVLIGSDAERTKAKSRALQILPVVVGFGVGCGLGAMAEAAAGLWSLVLPTVLALLAFAHYRVGRDTEQVQR